MQDTEAAVKRFEVLVRLGRENPTEFQRQRAWDMEQKMTKGPVL